MKLILSLSLRNLFRQKRRSFLLGIAICFGMSILVIVNSFSHGMTDNLLNGKIIYLTGHIEVAVMEKSRMLNRIIRDKDKLINIIKSNIEGIKEINESFAIYTRIIGIGRADNLVIVASNGKKETMEFLRSEKLSGEVNDFLRSDIENPVIIYSDKAKFLNVKVNDILKIRLTTVTGQQQSARLTVVAILKTTNMLESFTVYANLRDLKNLLCLRPQETGALQINFNKLDDPKFVIKQADKLHNFLKPGMAVISGSISNRKFTDQATVLGISTSEDSKKLLTQNLKLIRGGIPDGKSEKCAMITSDLAKKLYLKEGDSFILNHKKKFEDKTAENTYRVAAIFDSDKIPSKNLVLLQEDYFYKTYLEDMPEDIDKTKEAYIQYTKSALSPVLAPEYKLLSRTANEEDLRRKLVNMSKTRWKGPTMDVHTMYESASQILDLEQALNYITLIAVLVLFFIILIGVINTLRMTIRERTREIGTVRAIGMQKNDVRNSFIMETVLLSFFSCIGGIILSFVMMWIASQFTIEIDSVLTLFLVHKHLYFLPTFGSITGNLLLILFITAVTAYFPSRRAANLSAAEALRHFD